MKLRYATVIRFALIASMLSACYPVSNRPLPQNKEGSAQPSGTPIPELTNTANNQEIRNTAESPKTDEQVKVSNGGLTAEIKSIDINPDWPTITLCADVPSTADWLPRFSATYRGKKVPIVGWMLLDPTNTASKMNTRCYAANISTDIFASGPPSGALLFSLDYWETSTSENAPKQTPVIVNGPWVFAIDLPSPTLATSSLLLSTGTPFLPSPTSAPIIMEFNYLLSEPNCKKAVPVQP